MSLGDVQAFIQYSRQFTQPLTQVASMANLLQSGVASAERVFELLDAEEQAPDAGRRRHGRRRRTGGSSSSTCRSATTPDKPLIEDLSLVAEPGQTVAIVGPTGAGKTTLVNLIMRFYELDAGRITLDGVDIADDAPRRPARPDRHGAAGHLAVRRHDPRQHRLRPARTPPRRRSSRRRGRPTSTGSCTRLPDGYDTVIDDEGSNVSAGEKQLITIARAFLADPALLILDEATSSVDTRTEVLVQQAMAALRTDRTSFVIAMPCRGSSAASRRPTALR